MFQRTRFNWKSTIRQRLNAGVCELCGKKHADLYEVYVVRNLKEFKCGSVVISFDNQISKDTDLYKLYNTNIHDIITYVAERDYDIMYRDLSHSYEIYPVRWKVPQMQAGGKSGQHWKSLKGYSAYAFFHGSKFFPSISSGETTQDVLSAYVAEFNKQMRKEIPHPLPSRKSM